MFVQNQFYPFNESMQFSAIALYSALLPIELAKSFSFRL